MSSNLEVYIPVLEACYKLFCSFFVSSRCHHFLILLFNPFNPDQVLVLERKGQSPSKCMESSFFAEDEIRENKSWDWTAWRGRLKDRLWLPRSKHLKQECAWKLWESEESLSHPVLHHARGNRYNLFRVWPLSCASLINLFNVGQR